MEIVPVGLAGSADEEAMMSPDEIARTLAAMDQVEPFEMTEEEEAAIAADRRDRTEWEKARFVDHAEGLRGVWE